MPNTDKKIKKQENSTDMLSRFDNFLKRHEKLFFIISIVLTIIFAAMLFNPLVSIGGDDSAYLIRASRFVNNFTFPTFQGPLYPIVLSLFVLLFGINIVFFKILSIFFILGHLYFFHKTFKDKIPSSIHVFTILILSINSSYLYFAYQTYVEAFFLFIQSIAIWYFVEYFIDIEDISFKLKKDYKKYLYLGLVILMIGLTRSVGYAFIAVILLYFIIYRKWHAILPTIGSFAIFYSFYMLLKKIIWGLSGADFSGQGKGLLYKNYYNHAEGKEDLIGFIQRFWDNSNLYLSKHLYIFLGFKEYEPGMKVVPWLTILTYILLFTAFILVIKKNKHIIFSLLYVGVLCFATFVIIQKSWDQARLVIPYFPLILVILSSGIYYLLKQKKLVKLQLIFPLLLTFIFLSSFKISAEKSKKNSELKGPWYDLTPDWVNYIKCSKWAAKNVPKEAKIASRKPSISFIHSKGREFVGIYQFKSLNSGDIFTNLEDSIYFVIPFKNVFNNNTNGQIQMYLRQKIEFILNDGKQLTGIFKPEKPQFNAFMQILKQANIEYSVSPKQYYVDNNIAATKNYTVSPDQLLEVFQRSDVEYIVRAHLRAFPQQKTERTIDTIQRYLFFIEQKYPGIFEKIVQIGENNNEPAILYRIKYKMYGLEK